MRNQAASLQEPVLRYHHLEATFQKRHKIFTDASVGSIDVPQDYCKLLFVGRVGHLISNDAKIFCLFHTDENLVENVVAKDLNHLVLYVR